MNPILKRPKDDEINIVEPIIPFWLSSAFAISISSSVIVLLFLVADGKI